MRSKSCRGSASSVVSAVRGSASTEKDDFKLGRRNSFFGATTLRKKNRRQRIDCSCKTESLPLLGSLDVLNSTNNEDFEVLTPDSRRELKRREDEIREAFIRQTSLLSQEQKEIVPRVVTAPIPRTSLTSMTDPSVQSTSTPEMGTKEESKNEEMEEENHQITNSCEEEVTEEGTEVEEIQEEIQQVRLATRTYDQRGNVVMRSRTPSIPKAVIHGRVHSYISTGSCSGTGFVTPPLLSIQSGEFPPYHYPQEQERTGENKEESEEFGFEYSMEMGATLNSSFERGTQGEDLEECNSLTENDGEGKEESKVCAHELVNVLQFCGALDYDANRILHCGARDYDANMILQCGAINQDGSRGSPLSVINLVYNHVRSLTLSCKNGFGHDDEEEFVLDFLHTMMTKGITLLHWQPPKSQNNPSLEWNGRTVNMMIERGSTKSNNKHIQPRVEWTNLAGGQTFDVTIGGVCLLSILAITCHVQEEGKYSEWEDNTSDSGEACFFSITDNKGDVYLFEANSTDERDRIVRGLKQLIARLVYHLVAGNPAGTSELYDDEGLPPEKERMEDFPVGPPRQAMNRITHALLDGQ